MKVVDALSQPRRKAHSSSSDSEEENEVEVGLEDAPIKEIKVTFESSPTQKEPSKDTGIANKRTHREGKKNK